MVEVTEDDIQAVKAFHDASARHVLTALKGKSIGEAMGANNTSHPIYQAFAQHRTNALRALADDPAMVERVVQNMKQQMENEDENTPSSIQRGKGLVWLEGWFDMAAVLRAIGGVE